MHFSLFLDEEIKTKEQEDAYYEIIKFLDTIEFLDLPKDLMEELEEAMDFWDNDKIIEFNKKKLEDYKNPEKFLDENFDNMVKYMDYKESEVYENSSIKKISDLMKDFTETSGYNEILISNMRVLSKQYDEYYKNLLQFNEMFLLKLEKYKKTNRLD